jgi:hypothetical protein
LTVVSELLAIEPSTSSVPPLTFVAPVYVLVAEKVALPPVTLWATIWLPELLPKIPFEFCRKIRLYGALVVLYVY